MVIFLELTYISPSLMCVKLYGFSEYLVASDFFCHLSYLVLNVSSVKVNVNSDSVDFSCLLGKGL